MELKTAKFSNFWYITKIKTISLNFWVWNIQWKNQTNGNPKKLEYGLFHLTYLQYFQRRKTALSGAKLKQDWITRINIQSHIHITLLKKVSYQFYHQGHLHKNRSYLVFPTLTSDCCRFPTLFLQILQISNIFDFSQNFLKLIT